MTKMIKMTTNVRKDKNVKTEKCYFGENSKTLANANKNV